MTNDQAALQRYDTSGLPVRRTAREELLRTHFAVPAREMLFAEPEVCPAYGGLTFDGIAVTDADDVHLILRCPNARAYFGPDSETVSRLGLILAAGLRDSALPPRPADMPMLMIWLMACWTTTLAEIETARTGSGPAMLAAVDAVGSALAAGRWTHTTPSLLGSADLVECVR